jgi:histidine triad (HIT) family protein
LAFDVNCIFCKIVAEQAPASVVYQDGTTIAFLDIRPLNIGHILVIPKAHYVDIFDIPADLLGHVHKISKIVAPAVKSAAEADGISIIQQNGRAAGQDIFHLHVHVVPRFEGQKLPRFSELSMVERSVLDEMATKIKRCL